jgi:hypothetical protein
MQWFARVSIIREVNRLLCIQDGIVKIGQVTDALEKSFLEESQLGETFCSARMSVTRDVNCPLCIRDSVLEIGQVAEVLEAT